MHGVAIAVWVGALAPLALGLRRSGGGQGTAALQRFSKIAPLPLLAVVVAGTVLAAIQVETPGALLSTAYGRLLVAKLTLVALLFLLAARNRWRLTGPTIIGNPAAGRRLVRATVVEIVLITLVLGIAAAWRFTPPPRVIAIEAAKPASVHLHGDKAMADVMITPGRAGTVAVSIFVMAPNFDPLHAKEVMLSLANPAAGIERIKRKAVASEDGWRVDDLTVPLGGKWTIGVDVLISDFDIAKLTGAIEIRP